MKNILKSSLPYISAVILFFVISVGYFAPVIFQDKTLNQTDIREGAGSGQDLKEYQQETGEKSLWGSRMFAGMPAYQISPSYKTAPVLIQLRNAFQGWLPDPASYLFAYMTGFFILLLALRVNPWIAIIGAIAYGFSSYFLIIIEAGHIWKVFVLGFIPPTLAGIVRVYRGKLLTGGIVTMLFLTMQLSSNHIQMTYYFLLFTGIFVIGRFIYDFKNKQLLQFLKASAVLLVAGLIGFGVNSTGMILSQKYATQTIRGKSELTDNRGNKTNGLDRDYVTEWSYGIGETFTLLIPNTKGGSSKPVGYTQKNGRWQRDNNKNRSALDKIQSPEIREFAAQQGSYWGAQPSTSGPVYAGAFIMFLFVFGLFVIKGYLKWALLTGTVFSILLSWGHNFMGLTNLFLDYFPMYNKFRAVSSILVVAELAIPVLALLALAKIVETPTLTVTKKKEFLISLGATAGIAFLFILAPTLFFNFFSASDVETLESYNLSQAVQAAILRDLETMRISIFRTDAWRSIVIILLGVSLLWLYSAKKIKQPMLIGSLAVLTLFDLAMVDKRYLNNDDFVPKSMAKVAWEMTEADRQILEDKDPNYRVFNLSVSPFRDASTSFYHKSIGGYHAAKLRRYQELTDQYLIKMDMPVINMLNTRYLIMPDNNGGTQVHFNTEAMGNAWFVDSLYVVQNADEEIAALGEVDLKTTAVVDTRFGKQLEGFVPQRDETASIELTAYKINDLQYKVTAKSEQVVVFSEIYYNDSLTAWEAFIDGQPVPHFRANYVLRALRVPAGEHTIEFVFKPKAYARLETASMSCLVVLLLTTVAALGFSVYKTVRKTKDAA